MLHCFKMGFSTKTIEALFVSFCFWCLFKKHMFYFVFLLANQHNSNQYVIDRVVTIIISLVNSNTSDMVLDMMLGSY